MPATTEYFHRDKRNKDGLVSSCKKCSCKRVKKWQEDNPEKHRDGNRRWRENNREKYRDMKRRWRAANREKANDSSRRWGAVNREKVSKTVNKWRRDNPGKQHAIKLRYKSRKLRLKHAFSYIDERRALNYFNGCCAVCGRPLRDLFGDHTVAMDHWIALSDPRSDNPGTVPENMVPLCHGKNGCNNKKGNRDPEEWLVSEFGRRKANAILKRIENYFDEVRRGRRRKAA